MPDMSGAPIGKVFPHILDNLTAPEIQRAVSLLVMREEPSSFAVTSEPGNNRYRLRLSNPSYEFLRAKLAEDLGGHAMPA